MCTSCYVYVNKCAILCYFLQWYFSYYHYCLATLNFFALIATYWKLLNLQPGFVKHKVKMLQLHNYSQKISRESFDEMTFKCKKYLIVTLQYITLLTFDHKECLQNLWKLYHLKSLSYMVLIMLLSYTYNSLLLLLSVGFILHAGILYFVGIWLFHLSHLLFALAFPIKAKNFMMDHSTTCHITEVIIILVLGSLPGAIIVGTSKYHINSFPPEFCIPGNLSVFFHSFELPVAIGATVGLSMSFTAFWILRRVSCSK